MSEESDNQQASGSKPAAARRRRPPRRRAPRRKNEEPADRAAVERLENGNSGGGEQTQVRSEDQEGQGGGNRGRRQDSDDSRSDHHSDSVLDSPDSGAAEIASTAVEKGQLGNDERAETLSPREASEAVATPPENERRFRDRDRDRDRDRNQGSSNGDRNQQQQQPVELEFGEGIIEISGKGFGFLRDPKRNFVQTPQDIFVTPEIVRRFALRDGMWVQGETRRGNRGPQLMRLNKINDDEPTKYQDLVPFEELTTINPNKRIKLETVPDRYTTRIMDLMTPLGMGQRGIIVAPPRTGKTTLLHHIADAVTKNHPEMKLIILLVDERPEEVTDFRRSCPGAEIMASSNDSDIKSHTRIAQLAIERSKRMVEAGKHVFILLDSITRTARAFNNATGGGGRTMSGGIDARAMEIPRKIFAAARNTEEAGSLTIVATALIETGSRMDELIFQEFKGTGNMELVLDRKISDSRVYPAVDIFLSGTRREELLLQSWELEKINLIRRGLAG
ncbi:MAG: transcription termination factor Rho, partial [Chthoniobacterales bacterium]|nr:transcription termination factor Rho [Chthoniobacterales bacterium]